MEQLLHHLIQTFPVWGAMRGWQVQQLQQLLLNLLQRPHLSPLTSSVTAARLAAFP